MFDVLSHFSLVKDHNILLLPFYSLSKSGKRVWCWIKSLNLATNPYWCQYYIRKPMFREKVTRSNTGNIVMMQSKQLIPNKHFRDILWCCVPCILSAQLESMKSGLQKYWTLLAATEVNRSCAWIYKVLSNIKYFKNEVLGISNWVSKMSGYFWP